MLPKLATISTSNLSRSTSATIGNIDLEGEAVECYLYDNGSVGITVRGRFEIARSTEDAWLLLFLAKHNLTRSAQSLICCKQTAIVHGCVYMQAPGYIQEQYQGEDDQPCVGGYEYIWWLSFDGEIITSMDREYVVREFALRVTQITVEMLPF
jgi:hypothetical protein